MANDLQSRQRLAGGSGGTKGSASANPSGFKKALPNNSYIEGEFSRVNEKAIGRPVSPAKTGLGGGGIGTGIASEVLSQPKIKEQINQAVRSGLNKVGATPEEVARPNDMRLRGYEAPTIGRHAAQRVPTDPQAALAAYQRQKALMGSKRGSDPIVDQINPDVPVAKSLSSPQANLVIAPKKVTYDYKQGDVAGPSNTYSSKLGDVSTTQLADGTLKMELGGNRFGSVKFNDGRKLSPEQVENLNRRIAYNASPEGRAEFARNAEISNQRQNEYIGMLDADAARENAILQSKLNYSLQQANRAHQQPTLMEEFDSQMGAVQMGNLMKEGKIRTAKLLQDQIDSRNQLNQRTYEANLNANLDRQKLSAQINMNDADNQAATQSAYYSSLKGARDAELAAARLGFDVRKYQGEAAQKGTTEANKQSTELLKAVLTARKDGMMDVSQAASVLTSDGTPMTYNKLGAVLDQDQIKEFNAAPDDGARQDMLVDWGFNPSHIESVINDYKRLGQ